MKTDTLETVSLTNCKEALLVHYSPEDTLLESAIHVIEDAVFDVMSVLTERERQVLKLRFFDHKSLSQSGIDMGVTRERVRQLEAKALRKLRSPKSIKKLGEYLPNGDE